MSQLEPQSNSDLIKKNNMGFIKSGSEDFFPPDLAKTLNDFNSFPASKWGFVTYDIKSGETDWQHGQRICKALKEIAEPAAKVECFLSPISREKELKDWSRDYPLRHPWPGGDVVTELMNNTLAKVMVLPDTDLVTLMREDPFGSADELMARVVNKNLIQLEAKNGFLFDPVSSRLVIPLHFQHEPMNTAATEAFVDAVSAACGEDQACLSQTGFTGGFFASVENKQQIMKDLTSVSWLSVLILLAFLGSVLWSGRGRLFALFAPVAIGLVAACATMILFFQGIHGLVLSFGAGIVGLSVDYGLHAAFHKNENVWRSNLFGLLTTCIVLVVIAFSSIPLMRQLMIFTLVGIIVSFVAIFVMFWAAERRGIDLSVEPLKKTPKEHKTLGILLLLLAVIGMSGAFFKKFDLNLHRLNYMSTRTAEITGWLHERMGRVMPLFYINNETKSRKLLAATYEEQQFALEHDIRLENLGAYLPSLDLQESNHRSWFDANCQPLSPQATASSGIVFSEVAQIFFQPYLARFDCDLIKPIIPESGPVPSYVKHLFSGKSWLSIWMPTGPVQEALIRESFPQVFSLLDVAESFPRLLVNELRWMLPTSVGIIFLILLGYYRKAGFALAALLPFFSGLGTVFVAMWMMQLEVNFIVIVSMLMLCGLSVDYGIFAVDRLRRGEINERATPSALLFASASTSSGMIPLVFCSHPVLVSLGLPLCIGIVGALGAAFWGIPFLLKSSNQRVE